MQLINNYFKHYQGIPKNAWCIIFSVCFYSMAYPAIIFLPLYMHLTLHQSVFAAGIAVSALGVGTIVAAFYGTRLSDYFPARRVFLTGMSIFTLCTMLLYFTPGPYWLILLILIVLGMANSTCLSTGRIYLMRMVSATDQARVNGIRYIILNMGIMLSFAVVGFIIQGHYQRVFLLSTACAFIACLCLYFFCQSDVLPKAQQTKVKGAFWREKIFVVAFTYYFIGMLIFTQCNSTLSLFLVKNYHTTPTQLSFLFVLNCLLIVVLQMPLLNRTKHFLQIKVMSIGGFVMALGFFILLFGSHYWLAIVSMTIMTIGEMLFMPVSQTVIYQHASEALKGYYLGIYQTIYAISLMFGPFFGTLALSLNASGVLLWGGCLVLAALPLLARWWYAN